MLPFTVSDCECISYLSMATSPYCSFSWGEIDSIISPSLAASNPDSSTTTFGHSLLCPTFRLRHTPTYHAARSVLLPTLHLNLTLSQSSSRAINALLQRLDHKKAGLQQNCIPSFPGKASASVLTRVLHQQHYVGTSSSPSTFKIIRCVTPTLRSLARMITLQG